MLLLIWRYNSIRSFTFLGTSFMNPLWDEMWYDSLRGDETV
jgi:hypothetical protein